ncbi:MAG TPA: pseudouridine synthase [Candidatus Paceibacterota bacterium]|nr:pseudouridine synthase [Candidatus Paceibacterota bacterium]
MRINRYLAERGETTRRGADELIAAGKVFINGHRAELGEQVEEGDSVEVRHGRGGKKQLVYFAYNKPKGVVTHSHQEEDDTDILELLKRDPRMKGVFPVGRLDKDSYGLIILTNDGRITDRLLNPDRAHEKEYVVRVREKMRPSFKQHMENGVDIEGYITKPAKVRILGDLSFGIVLTEGKKHQIRRMVSALHNETRELKRVRIMNVKLGGLPTGQYRPIEDAELQEFLSKLGLA